MHCCLCRRARLVASSSVPLWASKAEGLFVLALCIPHPTSVAEEIYHSDKELTQYQNITVSDGEGQAFMPKWRLVGFHASEIFTTY